ncbi:MAG: hypothetical protein DMD96_03930 [Candidatus Rokuibacteriota bacterium]|nr:MAG: hypothetical protein DMD96_03930 [Candidatus Rokubacteria bacterium]
MAKARRYLFLRAWAEGQVVGGCLVMILGGLAALAVFMSWPADLFALVPGEWRARLGLPAAALILLLSLVVGGALVLGGELLLLLRDIHRRLVRMDARDRRRVRDPERSAERRDATARLIPRR